MNEAVSLSTPVPQARDLNRGAPRVWEYTDYRAFLSEWVRFKKMTVSGFSGASFARRARLQSHTLLGLVVRGQRNLTAQSIRAFSRALELIGKEAKYFEALVLFNQSKDSEDKRYYFEQALAISQGVGKRKLEAIRDYAAYLSHWYIPAVRELVRIPAFQPTPEWMSSALKHRITRAEAEQAWHTLLSLGFVREGAAGFEQAQPHLDISPGETDFVIRNYHREQLARGNQSIDGEPFEDRQLSSLTLSLNGPDYMRLQERLEEFRKTLNLEFPQSVDPADRVVVWNSQMIQLTRSDLPSLSNPSKENKK